MSIDAGRLEAATMASWQALMPDKDLEFYRTEEPEFVDTHREHVKALMENGFDPKRSIPVVTGGKQRFDDLYESGRTFQTRLADFLKEWCRRYR